MFAMDYNIFILYVHLVVIVPIVTIVPFVCFFKSSGWSKESIINAGASRFYKVQPPPHPQNVCTVSNVPKNTFCSM